MSPLAQERANSAELAGKRVTVMGLGRFAGGVGAARWLAAQGARVLVTDQARPDALQESVQALADAPVEFVLGEHRERDFVDADLVVVNPAVPPHSPFLQAALAAGVPVTTEINLFVERCRARTVGVTGSVGKSTVTAMIGHVLARTLAPRRVLVGGNIGASLLAELPRIGADDVVVLELSSFQLERTPAVRWSPHVAVLTNLAPNHLDWHGSFAAYAAAKFNIVRFQEPGRDWIVCEDSPDLREHFEAMYGDLAGIWRYSLDACGAPQARLQSTSATEADDRRVAWPALQLEVPGRHNRVNAAAALTVAHVLGAAGDDAVAALASFEALPHRLQRVAVRGGVTYYDDSKSTTPEAALTAMEALSEPLLIILGGYDKGSDLSALARRAAGRARFAACIGKTGARIAELVLRAGGQAHDCGTLERAIVECRARAAAGDAILLSPGCASWDQFSDYRARGELFARLAREG